MAPLNLLPTLPQLRPLPSLLPPSLAPANQAVGAMQLSPQEADSMLGQLGGSVLNGVSAASGALDTATGGRYVRNVLGLLTGNDKASFGELFTPSIIGNLTDAIGLTDYQNSVQPEDLTGTDSFLPNFIVGAALDPGTYVSFGGGAVAKGLGKAGALAAKAGILDDAAKGVAKQMGRNIGTVGPRLARTQGTLRSIIGDIDNPASTFLGAIDEPARRAAVLDNLNMNAAKAGVKLTDVLDQPLGGMARFKFPFLPEKIIGSGPGVADLAESLDTVGRTIGNLPGIRTIRANFDKTVGGASSALGQAIGRITGRARQFNEEQALGNAADVFQRIKQGGLDAETLGMDPIKWRDDIRNLLEGQPTQHLSPQAAQGIQQIIPDIRQGMNSDLAMIDLMGGDAKQWVSDHGTEYFPRQSILPEAVDTKGGGGAFGKKVVQTSDEFATPRNEIFDVPGGTETLNKITRDKELTGRYRTTPGTIPALDDAQAAEKIRRQYLGFDDAKAAELAKWYDQATNETGAFKTVAMHKLRQILNAKAPVAAKKVITDADRTPQQIAMDVVREELSGGGSDFIRRYGTPEEIAQLDARIAAKKAAAAAEAADTRVPMTDKEVLGAIGAQVEKNNNIVKQSEGLAEHAGKLHPWYAESGRGLFDQDPVESLMRYRMRRANVRAGLSTTHDVLSDWATEIQPGQWPTKMAEAERTMGKFFASQATREPHDFWVPLPDALKQAGLETDNALQFQAAKLSQKLGRQVDVDELSKMYVPKDVVEPLTRTMKAFRQPEEAAQFFSFANKFTNMFKTYALLRPSFFTRNLMSGAWTNYVLNGSDPRFTNPLDYRKWLQPYADARTLVKGGVIKDASQIPMFQGRNLTDAQATDEIRKLVFGKRVAGSFASQAGEIVGASGDFASDFAGRIPGAIPTPSMDPFSVAKRAIPKTWQEAHPLNTAGVRSLSGNLNSFVREGGNLNQYVEDLNRISPFIAKLRQGVDPSEAARQVRIAHVDYQSLTDFERKYAKSLIPFYSYTRGVLPWLIRDVIENPGGANRQLMRALTESRGEGFLPDYLAQSSAIPLPDWLAGESPTGSKKFLTGLDTPVEQLNLFSKGPGLYGTIKATGNNLIGMTNPLLKTAGELVTGRSFFQQGRPLEELEPTLGRLAVNAGMLSDPREIKQALGGSLGSPIADELLAMSPLAPTLSIAKTIGDSRKSAAAKAANILTGARISDVDMERQKSLQARKLLEDSLRGQPGIKAYEHIYSNKADFEKLSPEDKRRYLLYKQLSDEAIKKAREQKKKAG